MIRQGFISGTQAVPLLWFAMAGKVFLTILGSLVREHYNAAWLVLIGAALVALVAFVPSILLARRFPRSSFMRAADEAGGLPLGKSFGLSVGALLFVIFSLALREFSESFVIGILPATPLEVIVVSFCLVVGYTAYTGLESLGRITVFLTPWLLVIFLLVLLSEFADVSLLRVFPFWGPGAGTLAVGSLIGSSIYAEVVILAILFPYLRDRVRALAIGVWAVLLSAALMAATQLVFVGSFDVEGSQRFIFPVLAIARTLGSGGLLTRPDALYVFLVIFTAAVNLSVVLWAASTSLAETFRLKDSRPLVPALVTLGVVAALRLGELEQVTRLHFEVIRGWGWTVAFAFPTILWVLAVVRRRSDRGPLPEGGGDHAEERRDSPRSRP